MKWQKALQEFSICVIVFYVPMEDTWRIIIGKQHKEWWGEVLDNFDIPA